uniref:Uncharacterized protein n=1 Tax=Pelagomonas calceolata TaxID=35677 RepID=A0A7S4EC12_9STRA|mmetsp:Transcript_3947/g.11159  ORF Transcript_3947/g.11159 Transcript_3947/m.11159 type:complete len:122 (-) Transcript_3947:248-613(-)
MRQDDVPAEKPFARECGARTIDAAARVGHRRRRAARAPAKPVVRAGVGPAKVRRRRGRIATWSRRRGPTRVEAVLVASRTTLRHARFVVDVANYARSPFSDGASVPRGACVARCLASETWS